MRTHLSDKSTRRRETTTARLASVAAVPASAYGIDRLLGGPLQPWHRSGLTVSELAARLAPDGLHRALVLASWLAWLVTAMAVVPLAFARRSGALAPDGGDTRGWEGDHPSRNRFQGPTRRPAVGPWSSTAASPDDDEADGRMGDPFAWGDRFDDPDPWRELGPAEAGMTTEDIDDGAAAPDGGAERRWWRGRDEARARPRRLRQPPFGRRRPPGPVREDDALTWDDVATPSGLDEEPVADGRVGDHRIVPSVQVQVGDESVDLLALGSVALAGDAEDVSELLCSMVVDVVSGRDAPAAALLVGFGHEMHALDGVTVVDDAEAASAHVRRLRAPLATCPADGSPVPAGPASMRRTTIAFVGRRGDDGPLEDLVRLIEGERPAAGGDGAGEGDGDGDGDAGVAGPRFAVVVAGELPAARWRLCAGEAPLTGALSEQDRSLDVAGTAHSADTGPQVATVAPIRGGRAGTSATVAEGTEAPAPAGQVEVCVLGRVRVCGAPSPFDRRPRLTELVVYLALHPEGATTDAWATALWPDRRVPQSTLANRLSETRIALGGARDGYAHLRKSGGRHHLGPEVSTDWYCFETLAAKSDPLAWREALTLVRGRPFEGLREPQWTILEGFAASIVSGVVELACRLAEHLLTAGDPEGAEWAARRGMLCCPWDERLYRLVMRAHDAAGNRAGVEAALRQLGRVLEADGDPLAAVHPETAALYRSLMARREAL